MEIRTETKVTIFNAAADTEYILTYPFEAEEGYISLEYINDTKDEAETAEIVLPVEVAREIIKQMQKLLNI